VREFLIGASALGHGFGLINRRGVRPFVVVPLILNTVVFVALIWLSADYFQNLLHGLMSYVPHWLSWLSWLLWLLFGGLVALSLFYGFSLLANLIGSPFNGYLSARVEQRITGTPPSAAPTNPLAEIVEAIAGELRKLVYFVLLALLVLLVSLVVFVVPGLNLLSPLIPALWFIFGAWTLALEYSDYPLGNRGMRFANQRELLRRYRARALGFGAATTLATLIPLVNLLVMPAAVAGATLLWSRDPGTPPS
jgi:CysZ protein